MTDRLALLSRLWLAWVACFRILLDRGFAQRVSQLRGPQANTASEPPPALPEAEAPAAPAAAKAAAPIGPALQLLSLLQREGRLVDFLMQDIAAFDDGQVGAAARAVHDGCRKALLKHAEIVPVRSEEEGGRVTVEQFDAAALKLTGNVVGSAPFTGTLRHRGWRAEALRLPVALKEHDAAILAPAEVEL